MKLAERIGILSSLGETILARPDWLEEAVARAYIANKWFTKENSWNALTAIATHFLNLEILTNWAEAYDVSDQLNVKKIGLVLAGNIPMVGFHDILCCFVMGHTSIVKLSSKDEILLTAIVDHLESIHRGTKERIVLTSKLSGFDAIIATGSNNSSTYFEEYFGMYPNIIRKNRNAVAVLNGEESEDDFIALGKDLFNYFGLGCRNVSKLYVPEEYQFDNLLGTLHEHYKELANHNKYRNNFDYNNSLFLLNKMSYLMSGSLIIKEDDAISSRIATAHYSYYCDKQSLEEELSSKREQIQCIVSKCEISGFKTFDFGQAQEPSISDYADGLDTMEFLKSL